MKLTFGGARGVEHLGRRRLVHAVAEVHGAETDARDPEAAVSEIGVIPLPSISARSRFDYACSETP
jgi:hypothetical protein